VDPRGRRLRLGGVGLVVVDGDPPVVDDTGMSEAVLDPLLGAVVAGRYHVERRLAAGGMGVVYIARQEPLGRRVALKVIRGDASDPVAQQRFEREARAASSVQDPHVVVVHDFGVIEGGAAHGGLFLAMELLEGETLRQRLGGAPLSWGQSIVLVRQVAQALAAAHARGVVHRDLKPENIMLGRSDGGGERCKVLDFGLAKGTGAAALVEAGPNLTRSGGFVGTPGYISPEVIDGATEDPRQDVYALGVIWWEALSGRHPFPAETPMKTLVRQLHEEPPALDDALRERAGVPDDGAALVVALMARDPARRPKDGVDVLARLDALKDTAAVIAAPPGLIDSNADTIAGTRRSLPTPWSGPPSAAPSPPTSVPTGPGSEAPTVQGRRPVPPPAPTPSTSPSPSSPSTSPSSGGRRRRFSLRQRLFAGLVGASVLGTVGGVVVLRLVERAPAVIEPVPDAPKTPPPVVATEVVVDGVPAFLALRQVRERLPTHTLHLYRAGHAELIVVGDVGADVADRLQDLELTLEAGEGVAPRRFVVEIVEIRAGRVVVAVRAVADAEVVLEDAGVVSVPGGLEP
jgi:eukaryotic-like serine/threonine-protein kinase